MLKNRKCPVGGYKTKVCLTSIGTVTAAFCLAWPAQAQSPEQLFRGLMDNAKQLHGRGQQAAQATPGVSAADMIGSPAASQTPERAVRWGTRQSLLAATRAGKLAEFGRGASEADRKMVVASVQRILMTEYKVPPISRDCFQIGGFPGDVTSLFGDIAAVNVMTLSDQPPDFTNTNVNRKYYVDSIQSRLEQLQSVRDRTHCDDEVLGRTVPHPYKAALVSLSGDYAKATRAYVEGERNRRKAAYQEVVANQQQEQQQRESSARAAEQQRIDADAARIRADEQRRAQKEKARIGG